MSFQASRLRPAQVVADRIDRGLSVPAVWDPICGIDQESHAFVQAALRPGGAIWEADQPYAGSPLECRLLILGASCERAGHADIAAIFRDLDAHARRSRADFEARRERHGPTCAVWLSAQRVLTGDELVQTTLDVFAVDESAVTQPSTGLTAAQEAALEPSGSGLTAAQEAALA